MSFKKKRGKEKNKNKVPWEGPQTYPLIYYVILMVLEAIKDAELQGQNAKYHLIPPPSTPSYPCIPCPHHPTPFLGIKIIFLAFYGLLQEDPIALQDVLKCYREGVTIGKTLCNLILG